MTLTVGAVSARTIDRWFTSHCGATHGVQKQHCLCLQQLRWPSMSDLRSISSMAGGEKPSLLFLCIAMNEKWFHGYVGRRNNKIYEALGLHHPMNFCQHKCHIPPKIVVVAFTGCACGGNIEDGGDGLMLGLVCVDAWQAEWRRRISVLVGRTMRVGSATMES